MTDEAPQNEMQEQPAPQEEEKKETPETVQELAPEADKEAEAGTASAKNAIQLQAQRYAYIEKLESLLDYSADVDVNMNDFNNVLHCKTQVLLELVSVAGYVATLPANDPQKKAADVLMSHLYKCYDKTEKLREKMLHKKYYMHSRKQRDAFFYSVSYQDFLNQPYEENNPLAGAFGKFMGAVVQDLPPDKRIHLAGIARSTGSTDLLTDLIRHPSSSIKAQMPNLITELYAKATDTDRQTANSYIQGLISNLTTLKNTKSMSDALEGVNAVSNLLTIGSAMANRA